MDNFIAEQKKKLEEVKKEIEERLEALGTKDAMGNWEVDFPDFSKGDMEIEEDEVEEYGNSLSVGAALKEELKKIERALEKIKEGTYGICDNCGKKIPKKRLEAYPQANICLNC